MAAFGVPPVIPGRDEQQIGGHESDSSSRGMAEGRGAGSAEAEAKRLERAERRKAQAEEEAAEDGDEEVAADTASNIQAGKRKADELRDRAAGPSKSKKALGGGGGKSRTRLTLGQKLEMLELLKQKVSHSELARRFGCSERSVSNVAQNREALEEEGASTTRNNASSRKRNAAFPEVDKRVVTLVESSRKNKIPVTRATIMSFGLDAKASLMAADTLTPEEKQRLDSFGASEKWAKNFVSRNGLVSSAVRGEAGRVDAGALEGGLREIGQQRKNDGFENMVNVDQTGLFLGLLPKRSYLSVSESRKTGRGTKGKNNGMSADDGGNAAGNEKEDGEDEDAGARVLAPPPSYVQLAPYFGPLEKFAAVSGNDEAAHFLQFARMSFITAHAARMTRQASIRKFGGVQ